MKKILLLATSLLVLSANSANACTCAPTTPKQSFESSSAVFSGGVIDVVGQETGSNEPVSSNEPVKVIFEVSKVWKGKVEQQLVVTTPASEASCGYSFQEGEEYLVYAYAQEAELQTNLCSGTKPLSEAQADLAVLGEGETPTAESSGKKNTPLTSGVSSLFRVDFLPGSSFEMKMKLGFAFDVDKQETHYHKRHKPTNYRNQNPR